MITKLLIFFSGMILGEFITVMIMAMCKSASEDEKEEQKAIAEEQQIRADERNKMRKIILEMKESACAMMWDREEFACERFLEQLDKLEEV